MKTSYISARIKEGVIEYSGNEDLGKYAYKSINSCEVDKNGREGLFIDFTFKVPKPNMIYGIYYPFAPEASFKQTSDFVPTYWNASFDKVKYFNNFNNIFVC